MIFRNKLQGSFLRNNLKTISQLSVNTMIFCNKIILLQNLPALYHVLNTGKVKPQPFLFYGDRIAIHHKKIDTMDSVRIWRTPSLLDWWYDTNSSGRTFVGALDYIVEKEAIKIDYININDKDNICSYEDRLTNEESAELMNSMIQFITGVAKQEQKKKIKLDVHENLRLYKQRFEEHGFVLTDRRCKDNRSWIETEKTVD